MPQHIRLIEEARTPGPKYVSLLSPPQRSTPGTSCAVRGAKTRIIGSFKSSQCAPRTVFLRVCRLSGAMSLVTSKQQTAFPLGNFRAAKLVVLISDCKRESGSGAGSESG
jgi:hypothetical protein